MTSLTRIIYISRSTFKWSVIDGGIEPAVARILSKSRVNNRKNGLVGVLYFGEGCFFQCLEGETATIEALYAKLLKDPRHKDLKVLVRKSITKLSFNDWAMKYVPVEDKIKQLLAEYGNKNFDPYQFEPELIRQMILLLHGNQEVDDGAIDGPQFNQQKRLSFRLNVSAIVISTIAIILSITTLLIVLSK